MIEIRSFLRDETNELHRELPLLADSAMLGRYTRPSSTDAAAAGPLTDSAASS